MISQMKYFRPNYVFFPTDFTEQDKSKLQYPVNVFRWKVNLAGWFRKRSPLHTCKIRWTDCFDKLNKMMQSEIQKGTQLQIRFDIPQQIQIALF